MVFYVNYGILNGVVDGVGVFYWIGLVIFDYLCKWGCDYGEKIMYYGYGVKID